MTTSPYMLEAINISKHFGELVALDNVSLKLRKGSFHALLGENGAGKSTLVKCIMGYYQPDQGEVLFGDRQQAITPCRFTACTRAIVSSQPGSSQSSQGQMPEQITRAST